MAKGFQFTLLIVAVGTAGLLAGCGGGSASGVSTESVLPVSGSHNSPAVSGTQTWSVLAGGDDRAEAFQALDFFNEKITIDAGDSVTWTANSNHLPHTVTFLGPQASPPPVATPSNNLPAGGSTYDGSVYTSSGTIVLGQTYTLMFPKPGVYPYLCLFHQPSMTGVVIVQPKGAPYPDTQGFYSGLGLQALNTALASAKSSVREFPYANGGTTLAAGISPGLNTGSSNASVMRFLDADVYDGKNTVVVSLGTTLTWVNLSSNAPHTVAFPAIGQPPPPNPFIVTGGPTYDGSAPATSGFMRPGQSFTLTFTKRGTYPYYCILHANSGMVGTVIVQ